MVAQVEIISKEIIKPSSPTPPHLSELKFSFLDQMASPMYSAFIFFYNKPKSNHNQAQISQRLKDSLSQTLTLFYPIAGKIQENSCINCDDSGVQFVEARVHGARISEIIEDPDMEDIKQFLPVEASSHHPRNEEMLLSVQINFFDDCGGIAIGVCLSHKIADGTSRAEFVRAWAANFRGVSHEIYPPVFGLTSQLFPPVEETALQTTTTSSSSSSTRFSGNQKLATKRFVLSKEKLAALKSEISSDPDSDLNDPTRVEAASAFIWKQIIHAVTARTNENGVEEEEEEAGGQEKVLFMGTHSVGLRPRLEPSLPPEAFGNCILVSPAFVEVEKENSINNNNNMKEIIKTHHLANQLRKAIRRVDGDYIKKVQIDGGGYYRRERVPLREMMQSGSGRCCIFSSWCRFPVYEMDFGWGKPVWVCCPPFPIKNSVVLMASSNRDAIEAWINMLEDDIEFLHID